MTSITLRVTGARACASVTGPLTSGMVGIPVTIEYDEAWKGLIKNLVCRCSPGGPDSGESRVILNVEGTATVPHEAMKPDMHLYLGIEGFSEKGKLVVPTTWAMCGVIQHGANADGDLSADPALPVWDQLQAQIEQIKQDSITQEQVADIQADVQAARSAAEAAVESLQNASGGLSTTAAALLVTILRGSATYSDQTGNIDALAVLLSQGETAAEGVVQNGTVLTITDGVTATQDGDTIRIT